MINTHTHTYTHTYTHTHINTPLGVYCIKIHSINYSSYSSLLISDSVSSLESFSSKYSSI